MTQGATNFGFADAEKTEQSNRELTYIAAISEALRTEAQGLLQGTALAAIMPVCLSALDASEP